MKNAKKCNYITLTIVFHRNGFNLNVGLKKNIFDLVNGDFGHWGPQNDQPSGQMTIYRKTEVIQSYLRIWGRYTPIESGPSEPKNGGFITNVNVELIRQPK